MKTKTLLSNPQTEQDLQDFLFDTMLPADLAVDWFCDRFNVSATDEVIDFVVDTHFGMFADQWWKWHRQDPKRSDPVPIIRTWTTNQCNEQVSSFTTRTLPPWCKRWWRTSNASTRQSMSIAWQWEQDASNLPTSPTGTSATAIDSLTD